MPEFRSVLELSALNGRNGFQLSGEMEFDLSGWSVASAGDVNGDGFADVIIGAPHPSDLSKSGTSYVVFGKEGGFASDIQLSSLNGRNGFQISGEALGDDSGWSVSAAGDVNGDGFDDVIIGARTADPNGNYSGGASYVVFGKASGFASNLQLSSLDGNNGFQLNGEAANDYSGHSVASAGDVNGDGFADVIIGAPGADPNGSDSGTSYVVFGKASGFASSLDLSSLNGANGFRLVGAAAVDDSGRSVASAGDVNGDGIADVIVGASGADPNGDYSGASYVVFGREGGFAANLQLSSLNGTNGFQISGEAAYDFSGYSAASAGDVNGDGFADLIIGAFGAGPPAHSFGASYVVFGKASGFASSFDLTSLNGTNGFRINGDKTVFNRSGNSVASAGDVNGDGFDDVIVGARRADTHGGYTGASCVVFGKKGGFPSDIQLSSLNGSNGFQINGERPLDRTGRSVSSADDVNGDGFADVIVGAPYASLYSVYEGGASYVVFGHKARDDVNRVGTPLDNTINGGSGNDTIRGLDGDDKLIAWEGHDLVLGGLGRDRLNGRAGFDRLIGGRGPDVLIGGFGGDVFDFNAATDSGPTEDSRDVIWDFGLGQDKIDLSDLGALTFIGTGAFTAPGQVRVVQHGPNTIVEVNLTGDETPEMTIALLDVAAATLTAEDFIL